MPGIIYHHILPHRCLPSIRMFEYHAVLTTGIAAECACGQVWIMYAHRPWFRRSFEARSRYGFWVRETWRQRQSRQREVGDPVEAVLSKGPRRASIEW